MVYQNDGGIFDGKIEQHGCSPRMEKELYRERDRPDPVQSGSGHPIVRPRPESGHLTVR